MIEPLPNCFSMASNAKPRALLLPSEADELELASPLVLSIFFSLAILPPF